MCWQHKIIKFKESWKGKGKRGQNIIYKTQTAQQRIGSSETEEHENEGTKRGGMGCLTEQN